VAKDMGSAAVWLSLVLVLVTWIIIMFFVFVFIYRSIYLLLLAIITLAPSVLISMSIIQLVFSQIHGPYRQIWKSEHRF
jgi:predicted exporter